MTPREFIDAIAPAAVESQRRSGVPASVTIAQAVLESAWGMSQLAREARNLFGIKVGESWAGATIAMPTTEYVNGRPVTVTARFRAYPDWQGSIDDHAVFLRTNPRYAAAFQAADSEAFARAIAAAGYATDPAYADKLINIMRSYGLGALDANGTQAQPVAMPAAADGAPPAAAPNIEAGTPAPADTFQEKAMDPFTAVAALATVIPDLIRKIGGDSPTAERKAQIADILVPVAKQIAGVDDTATAVGKVLSDPAARAQFQQAAAERWEDIAPFVKFDEESRGKARDFLDRMTSTGPVWREVGYAAGLLLISLLVIGVYAYLSIDLAHMADLTGRLREKVVDQWQIFAAAAVFFWLGSSSGSRRKDPPQQR